MAAHIYTPGRQRMDHRTMIRTDTPGVFRRGGSFCVVYYVDGKQRRKAFRSIDAAKQWKSAREQARDEAELAKIVKSTPPLQDLGKAMTYIRKTLSSLDGYPSSVVHEAMRRAYDTEDAINAAIRRSYEF